MSDSRSRSLSISQPERRNRNVSRSREISRESDISQRARGHAGGTRRTVMGRVRKPWLRSLRSPWLFAFRISRNGYFAFRISRNGHFAFRRCEIGHFDVSTVGHYGYYVEHYGARHSRRVSGAGQRAPMGQPRGGRQLGTEVVWQVATE